MAYLKFQADHIFTGTEILPDNFVLITDERGQVLEIISSKDAGEGIRQIKGILTPGFLNCHCHLELSHMKGLIPEKTGLIDFVFKVVTERHFSDEEIMDAIEKAEDEMLANGIVAVGDICNNTLTLAQKLKQRLAYYNFIEVSGWLPQAAEIRFSRSKSFYDSFEKISAQQASLVPHAPYSVSDELWNYLSPFFTGKTISIHNQETSFEDELFLLNEGDFLRMYEIMKIDNSFFKPTGKSSLQSYFPKLNTARNVILVHNTFTKEEDVIYANQQSSSMNRKNYFCICINANLYIEDKVPPLDMLMKHSCTMILGTDSLSSNHSLSILDEMKSIRNHFPHIGLKDLLQWATINGAKALQMDNELGSFEKGKRPGVVLISNLEQNNIAALSAAKRLI
ncbi:MAG: amidohydrolase family protein [Panacibacter sp.]